MKLLKAVMTVTESPITIAGSSCDVTASAEQMPRICTVMGLSFPNGVLNTSRFSTEKNFAISYTFS